MWAHIDYLVEYEFTNIFCIWIPSWNEIIKIQDIRFNEKIFYSLNEESDLTAILQKSIDHIIKMIDVSCDHDWFFLTKNLNLNSDFDNSDINLQEQVDQQLGRVSGAVAADMLDAAKQLEQSALPGNCRLRTSHVQLQPAARSSGSAWLSYCSASA